MSRILRKVVEGPWAEPSGCFHTGLPSRSQEGEGPPPGEGVAFGVRQQQQWGYL